MQRGTEELRTKAVIGQTAMDILYRHGKEKTPGGFLGVFSRAVYIAFAGDILLICANAAGTVPLGMCIEEEAFSRLRDFSLSASMNKESIEASRSHLAFGNIRLFFSYEAPLPAPFAQSLFSPDLLSVLSDLTGEANDISLSPLISGRAPDTCLAYVRAAIEQTPPLIKALLKEDSAALGLYVRQLSGLGCGLTPSCDDMLCGMLYTFCYFSSVSEKAGRCFNLLGEAVLKETKTSDISAAYLRCAARAERYDAVHNLLCSLCGNGKLRENAAALRGVGASSGTDMTCGIILACRCLNLS